MLKHLINIVATLELGCGNGYNFFDPIDKFNRHLICLCENKNVLKLEKTRCNLNGPTPASFIVYFRSFQTNIITNFTKC